MNSLPPVTRDTSRKSSFYSRAKARFQNICFC